MFCFCFFFLFEGSAGHLKSNKCGWKRGLHFSHFVGLRLSYRPGGSSMTRSSDLMTPRGLRGPRWRVAERQESGKALQLDRETKVLLGGKETCNPPSFYFDVITPNEKKKGGQGVADGGRRWGGMSGGPAWSMRGWTGRGD